AHVYVIKALRGDSDYGEGAGIDADLLADDIWVGAETTAPVVVADHRHEARARRQVIVIGKHAAEMRAHAQPSKEIAGDQLSRHVFRQAPVINGRIYPVVSEDTGKDRILLAHLPVDRIGDWDITQRAIKLEWVLVFEAADEDQLLRIFDGQPL